MADSPVKTDPSAEKAYASAAAELIAAKPADTAPAKAAATPDKSTAAPVSATTVKAEPAKAAPATPVKAEPVKAEPVKAEPVKAAPAKATPAKATPAKAAPAKAALVKAAPAKATRAKPARAKPAARKPAVTRRKPVAKANPAAIKAARRAARVAKAAAQPARTILTPKTTVSELKEKIMATKNTDYTQPIAQAFGEIQTRAKAAYEKGTEVTTEVTEFTKGNVDAFVESSKIFANGAQSIGKTYVEEAKSAYETITADVKELAAVKSPAELFQLQGKIFRRNLDTLVATTSKNGEAVIKLANATFAPFSGRVTVATEKLAKVA